MASGTFATPTAINPGIGLHGGASVKAIKVTFTDAAAGADSTEDLYLSDTVEPGGSWYSVGVILYLSAAAADSGDKIGAAIQGKFDGVWYNIIRTLDLTGVAAVGDAVAARWCINEDGTSTVGDVAGGLAAAGYIKEIPATAAQYLRIALIGTDTGGNMAFSGTACLYFMAA